MEPWQKFGLSLENEDKVIEALAVNLRSNKGEKNQSFVKRGRRKKSYRSTFEVEFLLISAPLCFAFPCILSVAVSVDVSELMMGFIVGLFGFVLWWQCLVPFATLGLCVCGVFY